MDKSIRELITQQYGRQAITMEIGGFRPSDDPAASWFGRVNLCASGETWPTQHGRPMHALAQLNLTELPFRPPSLEDIDFITVFIGPEMLPINNEENGSNWLLRAYKKVEDLRPLEKAEFTSSIKPFQMRPRIIESDFPCLDDLPFTLREQIEIEWYLDQFENHPGFKLGGWPYLIQSEISWAPYKQHPAKPKYVFQIDTTEKGNWMWGDNGVGYFGRGTSEGKTDHWFLDWQCY